MVEKDTVLSIDSRDWFCDCEKDIVAVDVVVVSVYEEIVVVLEAEEIVCRLLA